MAENLEDICNANNLVNAYYLAAQGTDWKESVQRYELDLLSNVVSTQKDIRRGKYKPKKMIVFHLCERGRTRSIKSQHISDRVVQRSTVDNVLIPRLKNKLIYDNGASMKGKGLDFARRRYEVDLRQAYREYNGEGYVLYIDFKKYFDNIVHETVCNMFAEVLNPAELDFIKGMFKEFEIDVSYMTDDEYALCMSSVFNAVEYDCIDKSLKTGEKFMRKSAGIGNQISQITGVYYPHEVDNYCKIVRGIKHYGRYMDDTYIMLDDKAKLLDVYENIKRICAKLGIFINEKKTTIKRLTDWQTFLKINYKVISPGGKLLRKVHSSTFARERRRFTKLKKLMLAGRLTPLEVLQCYRSWRGTYKKYDSGIKLRRLDKLFKQTFRRELLQCPINKF